MEQRTRLKQWKLAILLFSFTPLLDPALAVPLPANQQPAPACQQPEYRQFDFWIGEWEVFVAGDRRAGSNTISKLAGGCALLEHWQGARGMQGWSLNFYEPAKKKWVQVWTDSAGGVLVAEGNLTENGMHLIGEHTSATGQKELFRGTWTALGDGRVRQFLERSRDNGATWYVWFDGTYVKKKTE